MKNGVKTLWVNNLIAQTDILLSEGNRIFQWIDIHRKMRFFIGAKSGEVMTGRLTEEGSRNEYRSNR